MKIVAEVKKQNDGRWSAIVNLPPDPFTGERRRKFFKGNNKKDVLAKATALELKVLNGEFNSNGEMLYSVYLEKWQNIYCKDLAITTLQGYKRYIKKYIEPALGDIKLENMLPMKIQDLYNTMAGKKLTAKTILQVHSIIRKSLEDAVRNGFIHKNPCVMVKRPSAERYTPENVYDENDFNKLLSLSVGTEHELPILFAGLCGLRRSEVFGLTWEDIDLEKRTISVCRAAVPTEEEVTLKSTKNYTSKRTFVYPDCMQDILKEKRGIGLIFHEPDGTPTNGGNYSHRFKYFLDKHKLKHIRFHDLRHFNATMMLKSGISDKTAAERLGHANPNVTRAIYQHSISEMDYTAATKLNNIITAK